jgi:transcriptional regulator with XRE-family HTH domain
MQAACRAPAFPAMQAIAVDDATHRYRRRIGQNILLMREMLGLSQRELGDRMGIDRRQIVRWEAGEWAPNAKSFERLERATGYPREWFDKNHDEEGETTNAD